MRRRVEETLDLLGLADLRDRPIATLSGGQQQRVAIGSVLTPHPKVLVLDEPTSALDPAAAEDVLAVLQRLVHDLGTTVLLAEHRLERVVQYADQVVLLPAPGTPPVMGTPAEIMEISPVHPPVVALGRLAGWTPLPLSVRDARRRAATCATDRPPTRRGTPDPATLTEACAPPQAAPTDGGRTPTASTPHGGPAPRSHRRRRSWTDGPAAAPGAPPSGPPPADAPWPPVRPRPRAPPARPPQRPPPPWAYAAAGSRPCATWTSPSPRARPSP